MFDPTRNHRHAGHHFSMTDPPDPPAEKKEEEKEEESGSTSSWTKGKAPPINENINTGQQRITFYYISRLLLLCRVPSCVFLISTK